MVMFISGLVFVLIVLFFTMRADEVYITEFELQRRINSGNKRAEKLLLRKQLAPTYNLILRFISSLLVVVLVLLIREMTTAIQALMISSLLVLVAAGLSRVKLSQKIAREVFLYIKPYFLAIYIRLGEKTKRRIIRKGKHRTNQAFYSQEELIHLINKTGQQIVAQSERDWLDRIFALNNKKVSDLMTDKASLRLVHQTELLGPLVIDEMHKTDQDIFVVTDKSEAKVMGILEIEKISSLDNKTSQIAKNLMERDFMVVESGQNGLELFEEMVKTGRTFAVIQNDDLFLGIVTLPKILNL